MKVARALDRLDDSCHLTLVLAPLNFLFAAPWPFLHLPNGKLQLVWSDFSMQIAAPRSIQPGCLCSLCALGVCSSCPGRVTLGSSRREFLDGFASFAFIAFHCARCPVECALFVIFYALFGIFFSFDHTYFKIHQEMNNQTPL